jgi:YD repeat-containing protein
VDGPLPGAGDASDILVNRFGQPTRITNLGLNTVTTINYDSVVSLPALVTRVVYPHASVSGAAGRSVRMAWNARGNLMEVRDSTCRKLAGCSPAQVATTSYQYGDVINACDVNFEVRRSPR